MLPKFPILFLFLKRYYLNTLCHLGFISKFQSEEIHRGVACQEHHKKLAFAQITFFFKWYFYNFIIFYGSVPPVECDFLGD